MGKLIYLVDNTIDGQGVSPRELRAALSRICEGCEILTQPYHATTMERIESLNPSHIILSGQSHPWDQYSKQSLAGVFEVIKNARQPVLGVCGGHQQIALAYGAEVDLMERIHPGNGYEGAKRERGFFPVTTDGQAIFNGLPRSVTVWHSHCDEVKSVPEGFHVTATNQTCAIQAMEHNTRPVFGVQFHPELFDGEHPQGRQILENFLDTSKK